MSKPKLYGFFSELKNNSELLVSDNKGKVQEEQDSLFNKGAAVTNVHNISKRSIKQHIEFIREI